MANKDACLLACLHIILSRYIQIWHFYRTLSRGLLFSRTQCISRILQPIIAAPTWTTTAGTAGSMHAASKKWRQKSSRRKYWVKPWIMRRAEHVINYALERLTLMTLNPVTTNTVLRWPTARLTATGFHLQSQPVFLLDIQPGEFSPPPEILNSPEIFSWCKFLNVIPALLADTAVFSVFVKNVAARCNFQAQNTPKYVCGRGFAPNHTGGKLQSSLRPLVDFQKAASRHGRRG